jgi:hypothetical protein
MLAALTIALSAAPASERPEGPPAEAMGKGCYCHNPEESASVRAAIGGVPMIYDAGGKYYFHIAVLGGPAESKDPAARKGGFILGATQGTLAALKDDSTVVESQDTAGRTVLVGETRMEVSTVVTQSADGNRQRQWDVEWTAPSTPEGKTYFVLVVNSVNGVGGADPGDEWARTYAVSAGPGEPTAEVAIHDMGVKLMAYWLGVIGFIIILITMGFGYVLIRQGSEHYKFPDVPQGKRVLTGKKKS